MCPAANFSTIFTDPHPLLSGGTIGFANVVEDSEALDVAPWGNNDFGGGCLLSEAGFVLEVDTKALARMPESDLVKSLGPSLQELGTGVGFELVMAGSWTQVSVARSAAPSVHSAASDSGY